jgi:glycosidase
MLRRASWSAVVPGQPFTVGEILMFLSSRALRAVLALALVVAGAPIAALEVAAPVAANHHADPTSVTVAGGFQQEVGCPDDWQEACATTHLAEDANDDVWEGVFSIPAGSYEYKATINDSWTENYGASGVENGANVALNLGATTSVKFFYDENTHWLTDNVGSRIVTAAGSFQSELGCGGGTVDWAPDCLRSWLQDADGDGTYSFTTTALPAGSYETKATINEDWTENYGAAGASNGPNITFNVASDNASVTFSFVSSTNTLTVQTAAPGASHDNNIFWDDLGHDSRDTLYRTPGGAVVANTVVKLRLRSAAGDLTGAQVRLWNDRTDSQSVLNMAVAATLDGYDYWETTVPASNLPTIYWYRFLAIDGTATAYYEDDVARTGGWGETVGATNDRSWQLTVYDPSFTTPEWVKNAVIYQIFPDRFRDGDETNDTPDGSFFYNEATSIVRSDSANWNQSLCDPRNGASACPGVYSQNFYGGDLEGITDKLDYLQDLGVTAVYLNPIFESPSNHKYDTTDYGTVDDNFGGNAAFIALAADLHSRGMHLILDGVFNHTSSDSIYFDRYGRYSQVGACEDDTSDFRDWYYFSGTGACDGQNYESWFGYDSLPKLNASNDGVRDLIWQGDTPSPSEAIAPYWMQWADGWRLDVGGDVDPGVTNDPSNAYWEGFRAAVRAADPEAYIVGEEWAQATPWTLGSEWDATMNYQLSSALLSFFRDETFVDNDHNTGSSAGTLAPINPATFAERVLNLQERYPPEAFQALMNLLGSHDTSRPLFMLDHNADQNNAALYANPNYDWSDAITRLKGVAALQSTLPGAPTIYYGDEVGLVGPPTFDGSTWQDDPYNRVPYPWLDESGTPFYTHLQTEAGQDDLLDHYTTLFNLRGDHPALRTGDLRFFESGNTGVLAYGRKSADNSDAAIVLVNRSSEFVTISLNVAGYLAANATMTNALGGGMETISSGANFEGQVAANSVAIYVLDSPMTAAPDAVTDLTADGTAGAVDLDWTSTGAYTYRIYRSLVSGGGYELVTDVVGEPNGSAMQYTDTGLDNGTDYHYVVVARDDTTLLDSGYSNEASGTPGFDLNDSGNSWFNLQWPPSITHTISATDETDTIYGQIWINGVTSDAGATPGVRAQVGYGPDGTQPNGSWIWKEATFSSQQGSNDEYSASLQPEFVGSYDYAYRWSGNGGATWYLADQNGPQRDGTLDNPGNLAVSASGDTTSPGAPMLSLAGTSSSDVSLSWSASADETELAGYRVYRDGIQIASVDDSVTSYTDSSVTTGVEYDYTVKAFDTSFNFSGESNTVTATAENRLVDVTFTVAIPSYTPDDATIYVTGSADELGPWNPAAYPMTDNGDGTWSKTFSILEGTSIEWKYTRGSWETVEDWGSISGLGNRGPIFVDYGTDGTMEIDNTGSTGTDGEKAVQDWHDPLVVSHVPAADAVGVSADTTIVVTWSHSMNPAATQVTLIGPGDAIAGTYAWTVSNTVMTFAPEADLPPFTYNVSITGGQDAAGTNQQAGAAWSFTVGPPACTANPFTDVDADSTFCPEINWALENGITTGYGDGSFRPLNSVTRQAAAAFLARLAGAVLDPCEAQPFNDVAIDHPFCPQITWAKDNNITTGFSDGTFRPSAVVTRQAMAAFLARLAGASTTACSTPPFTDVPVTNPFCPQIAWAKANYVTTGFEDGSFHPSAVVTRQAMMAFLYRTSLLMTHT